MKTTIKSTLSEKRYATQQIIRKA